MGHLLWCRRSQVPYFYSLTLWNTFWEVNGDRIKPQIGLSHRTQEQSTFIKRSDVMRCNQITNPVQATWSLNGSVKRFDRCRNLGYSSCRFESSKMFGLWEKSHNVLKNNSSSLQRLWQCTPAQEIKIVVHDRMASCSLRSTYCNREVLLAWSIFYIGIVDNFLFEEHLVYQLCARTQHCQY